MLGIDRSPCSIHPCHSWIPQPISTLPLHWLGQRKKWVTNHSPGSLILASHMAPVATSHSLWFPSFRYPECWLRLLFFFTCSALQPTPVVCNVYLSSGGLLLVCIHVSRLLFDFSAPAYQHTQLSLPTVCGKLQKINYNTNFKINFFTLKLSYWPAWRCHPVSFGYHSYKVTLTPSTLSQTPNTFFQKKKKYEYYAAMQVNCCYFVTP